VVRVSEPGEGSGGWPLLLLLVLVLFATPTFAREEIREFNSAVTVMRDGSLYVTETIAVNTEGLEIRHGIFRDVFTTLANPDGSRVRSTFTVVSITRDGRDEPYTTSRIANGVELKIDDPDVFLADGVHRYIIRYTMSRMVRFFPDHDEVYWNATGNYWKFPILSATATVKLPEGAVISDVAVYTGKPGSQAHEASAERASDTLARFATTDVLLPTFDNIPGEGLTVAVAFQKGVVAEPSDTQKALYWFSDHRDLLLPGLAVLIILLYNYFAWDSVGRDPRKGTIIPLFHPPKGFSPALVHYIFRMGWRNSGWTAFTASIFDLGVKGLVQIDQRGKELTVTVTGKQPDKPLPPGESVLFAYLTSQGKVTVDKDTGKRINQTRGDMIRAIETESQQRYFKNNTTYVVGGAILSLFLLGALVLTDVLDVVWLIAAVVAGAALGLFATAFRGLWGGGGQRFRALVLIIWAVIFFGNAGLNFLNFSALASINTGVVAALSIVLIDVVFAVLLRAPTVQGRQIMDEIEGFRMYLDTAEKERLNMPGEPQMTVTRFESILPFAIALGVEKPWSEHFEAELARNAVPDAPGGGYSPGWYSGRSFSSTEGGFSNAVAAATTGMSAAMIAAQPSSSSGSGFGGGGGSGGGGGGGGGGGW
jgi:hypothetical protein